MQVYAERYEVVRDLGKGAAGKVVLVKDTKTGILCALKLVKLSFGRSAADVLKDFTSEFDILKNLNHPSIARVHDLGEDKEINRFYITTEFVDGKDLFAATENLSIDEIEDLFVQSLRALNYIHNQGVFHFDIKPQNILVTKNKEGKPIVKLIDFGFANFFERQKKKEGDTNFAIVGTGAYVPPEIILGESHDGRADLYSLACTFYKAFTRELAFSGKSDPEVHEQHLTMRHKDLTEYHKEIPEYLNRVFAKLLEKKPEGRYSTAQEVIEDLNILSGKEYPIETQETIVSYLPNKGSLIARDEEIRSFENFFEDRIFLESFKKKNYLVIVGDEGFGKTRLLQECKAYAQKHFTPIMTWAEAKKYSLDQMPKPYLVMGDDVLLSKDDLVYVEIAFERDPILFVFTTSQYDLVCDHDSIIELKPFTKDQTREFLIKATSFASLPEAILEDIYKHTRGIPLYLSEYVKALFEKGFFKNSHGSWSEKMLEDLGVEIGNIGVSEFIEKRLTEKLEKTELSEGHKNILYMMALSGKPTFGDLCDMTGALEIEKQIQELAKQGILEMDPEHRYIFSNSAYRDILLKQIPNDIKAELCDTIADYYETQGEPEEKILYFKGRGNNADAAGNLLKLARMQRSHMKFQEAKENLLELIGQKNASDQELSEAWLELGLICSAQGSYDESDGWLLKLTEKKDVGEDVLCQALERSGLNSCNRGDYPTALQYFKKAKNLLKGINELEWLKIVMQGYIARTEYNLDHCAQAIKLAEDTWNQWNTKLNDKEKEWAIRTDVEAVYFLNNDNEKAYDILKTKQRLIHNQHDLEDYPYIIYTLAEACLRLNKIDDAEKYLLECLDTLKRQKKTQSLFAVYNELGKLYDSKEQPEESYQYLKHAFDLAKIKAKGHAATISAYNIGTNRMRLALWDEAEKHFSYVIRNLEKNSVTDDLVVILHLFMAGVNLCEIYMRSDRRELLAERFRQVEELFLSKEFLKTYTQYYWQTKADFSEYTGDQKELKQALSELEKAKETQSFVEKDYMKWKEKRKAYLEPT